MKVFKIILITVLLLVALAVTGLYFFIKSFDIKKYKPRIVQELSESLNREVALKDISLSMSLQKGLLLEAEGLTVKDLPQYSAGNFLQVERAKFALELLPLVQERKVTVSGVIIQSPWVVFVRDSDGTTNVETIGKKKKDEPAEGEAGPGAAREHHRSNAAYQLPVLLVNAFSIDNATFVFIDRSRQPQVKMTVTNMDLKISNFSLFSPADLSFAAAVFSDKQNLKTNGKLRIDPKNHQGRLDDVKITLDLGQMQMERAIEVSESLKNLEMIGELRGQVQAEVTQLVFGLKGIVMLSANGNLNNGFIQLREHLKPPFENIQAAFEMTESDCNINSFSAWLGSGSVTGSGRLNDYLDKQRYTIKASAKDMKVQELLSGYSLPVKIIGNVQGETTVTGSGFDPQTAMNNLKGDGNVRVTDGRILDFNLLKSVLSKIALIPNLVSRIEDNLPERYLEVLNRKDTYLRNVVFESRIQDGGAELTKALVETDGFFLSGGGRYGFDQMIRMNGALTILQDLSQAMGTSVPELKLLFDDAGQIYIPIAPYDGPLDKVRVFPNMEYLGKRIIVNKGVDRLQKVIDKALGVEDEVGPDGQQKTTPERELIRGVLDSIFGE